MGVAYVSAWSMLAILMGDLDGGFDVAMSDSRVQMEGLRGDIEIVGCSFGALVSVDRSRA